MRVFTDIACWQGGCDIAMRALPLPCGPQAAERLCPAGPPQGLLAASGLVRAAALAALPNVPCIGERCLPASEEVVAVLWLACHDPEEANAAAAAELWADCGAALPPGGVASQLILHLGSPYPEVRAAASEALSKATAARPGTSGEVLQVLVDTYAAHPSQAVRQVGPLLSCASSSTAILIHLGTHCHGPALPPCCLSLGVPGRALR